MPARQPILLLVLSVLIALPAGVANAEIDVRNGDTRVRVSGDRGIKINRDYRVDTDYDDDNDYDYSSYPYEYDRYPRSTRTRAAQSRIYQRLRSLKYPRTTRSVQSCRGRSVAQQRTITSSSSTGSNRTYSSTTTTTCQ
ncbi:MAG: hypothetical protein KME30_28560 [Iphinoe sp. HA4291-MV1]|jgi:hypothetical protein|nr:hypothetical protein [Iphinoe sp. HA4291-MV1]